MDPFQTQFHDFSKKNVLVLDQALVQDLVQALVQDLVQDLVQLQDLV